MKLPRQLLPKGKGSLQLWLLLLFVEALVVFPQVQMIGKRRLSIGWQFGLGLVLSGMTLFWIWNLVNTVVQLRKGTKPLQASIGIFPLVVTSLLIWMLWWSFVGMVQRND